MSKLDIIALSGVVYKVPAQSHVELHIMVKLTYNMTHGSSFTNNKSSEITRVIRDDNLPNIVE